MLASLPMYDLPEIREATDAFWAALAKAYGVTNGLTRGADWKAVWQAPNLLFSQTCGYPFTHEFKGKLNYIATPHYDADGCEGPHYRSIVFARKAAPLSAFKSKVAAFNSKDSMSGYLALKLVFAKFSETQKSDVPFFSASLETGSHVASLANVEKGAADICAIDCVTVALLRKYRPSAFHNLIEVGRSPAIPGLPFVTKIGDAKQLNAALFRVMQDDDLAAVRKAMLLKDVGVMTPLVYDIILEKEADVSSANVL